MPAPPPVIVVSTYYPPVLGGAETASAQLAEFLAARGRAVTVITKRTDPSAPVDEIRNGVHVVRIPPAGPRTTWGKWLAIPFIVRELVRRRHDHAAVVCIDYRGVGLAALAARAMTGRPVILQAATDGVLSFGAIRKVLATLHLSGLARLVTWPLQQLYNRGDAYPCISRSIEAETRAAGVPADRVVYLPNPVDVEAFCAAGGEPREHVRARLGIAADARVAIIVGRLSREKGQLDALQAWAAAAVPNGVLLLVGPDMPGNAWDIGGEARDLVRREGLERRVVFTGGVAPGEVPAYLRAADLALQPSHFEAFGTSAIEAMAAGLPVIASDVGGLKDFVEPGVNGLRVPPRDVAQLAAAIRALLEDDAERARLAGGARETARRFDTSRVLGDFARLIDETAAHFPVKT